MATIADTFNLAWQHHQANSFPQAEQLYRQVLQADPNHADAWCFLGAACQAQGKNAEAEANLRRAVQLLPSHGSALNYLGIVQAQQGKFAEAVASFQQLLVYQPTDWDAHNNLGLVRAQEGKLDEAIACYQRALQLKPDFTTAQTNLSRTLEQKRAAPVQKTFAPVRTSSPEMAYAANMRGVALAQKGKLDEANACFEQALQFEPDNADAFINLGTVLDLQLKYDEALVQYRRALRLKPNHVEAHYNIGTVLDKQGKVHEAIASFQKAIAIDPRHVDGHNNLGNALRNTGQMEQALACFERAMRLKPDYGEGHLSRAVLWLVQGDFKRGWPEYEWRWRRAGYSERKFDKPIWNGSDLKGRTILLHAEQGLGDTIQFIRYAALVKERGGTVIVECQAKMLPLLASVPGVDQWVAQETPLPPFDFHAPLPSLPGIFHTDLATIPAKVSYLNADEGLVSKWRRERSLLKRFKIGIAWQGNPAFRDDRQRSIPLAWFARLAEVPGIQLISLQKGHGTDQLRDLTQSNQISVLDLSNRLDEGPAAFMDTAALMRNLDLVITSDTAIPHLAGALGVPVWTALQMVPDWRWLLNREDSPWYPTMRLFRQTEYGEWQDVFERIVSELRVLVEASGAANENRSD